MVLLKRLSPTDRPIIDKDRYSKLVGQSLLVNFLVFLFTPMMNFERQC